VEDLGNNEVNPQFASIICSVPWGHHRYIIDKCKGDGAKALFYVQKTIENNWSRAILLNGLDTDLYERQGKAISNFTNQLPPPQGDLAQEITKDPYNFDFLSMREGFDERELEDRGTVHPSSIHPWTARLQDNRTVPLSSGKDSLLEKYSEVHTDFFAF